MSAPTSPGRRTSKTPPRIAYSVREAAEILDLSERHVYRMAEKGQLASRRVGRRVLISAAAVDEFFVPAS